LNLTAGVKQVDLICRRADTGIVLMRTVVRVVIWRKGDTQIGRDTLRAGYRP
jgi:hypothetical protein